MKTWYVGRGPLGKPSKRAALTPWMGQVLPVCQLAALHRPSPGPPCRQEPSTASHSRLIAWRYRRALRSASWMNLAALPALSAQLSGHSWQLLARGSHGKPVSEGMLGLDPPPPTPDLVSARPVFDLTGSAVVALLSSPVTIRAPAQPGPAVEVVGYQDG